MPEKEHRCEGMRGSEYCLSTLYPAGDMMRPGWRLGQPKEENRTVDVIHDIRHCPRCGVRLEE